MPLVTGKKYVFYNHQAGTALDLDVGSNTVQGWTYHGGPNQQWTVISNFDEGGPFWTIQNVQTGAFLAYHPPAGNGKRVICTHESSGWIISQVDGNETYRFNVLHSQECVDLEGGGNTANGTPVQLWTSWGGDNQKWEAQGV